MGELVPADPPPLGHLVAALSPADGGADVASLARVLQGVLFDSLPAGMVEIEYDRSVGDRMKGRPGRPVAITVLAGDQTLILQSGRGGRPEPFVATIVRGVVISRRPVPLAEWIAALASALTTLATQDEAARGALNRLLLG